ncbi:MAG: class I mannose-6-phosphate isomerase [Tannerellaceae bacterium]|jgi:mannose-6-phosphate isomerase|nr:class I mannose-6-phosphate isomerase [Tannerellaceae bacterium]
MLYPITFRPILKKIIWGGADICPFKGITPAQDGIGESWEISHVEDNYSIVANGPLEGHNLDEILCACGKQWVGAKVMERFGAKFPLLVKFIDARDNLSIQVHPDDRLAWERHRSFGKTEMWYVVKATAGAALYSGFSQPIDADEYVRRVEDDTIMDVLQRYEVKAGDVFFLPAGRVHAIGRGCFIAEIQQTSNITYRIYDYNRKDADGRGRELHTALAKDAIDYTFRTDYRTHYEPRTDAVVPLVDCPYFTTNLLELEHAVGRDFSALDSFVIYICMDGQASLRDDKGHETILRRGQTLLIPADTQHIGLTPSPTAKLMETYIG